MATTTVLSNPAVVINSVSYTDQATAAQLTITKESLESTSFADSARTYTAGLQNLELSVTLMLAYGASEVEELLEALVGTQLSVDIYGTNSETASATNPKYAITNTYLESFSPVAGSLGELQQIDIVFTGGSYTRSTS